MKIPRTLLLAFTILVLDGTLHAQRIQSENAIPQNIRCVQVTDTSIFVGTYGDGVFVSSSSAPGWKAMNKGLTNTKIQAMVMSLMEGRTAILFVGTDGGGVYRSTDCGASWTATNRGLTNAHVLAMAVCPDVKGGTSILAATDGGGVFCSSDDGASWRATKNGLTNARVIALAAYPLGTKGTTILAGTIGGGVFRSIDNCRTWTPINTGLTHHYVRAFARIGSIIFVGTMPGGVFSSRDYGMSWRPVNRGLTNDCVLAMAVCVDGKGKSSIFAGTEGGGVFCSTDQGARWIAVNNGLRDADVTALASGPWGPSWIPNRDGSILIAGTTSGGVFFSTNAGSRWTAVDTLLALKPSTEKLPHRTVHKGSAPQSRRVRQVQFTLPAPRSVRCFAVSPPSGPAGGLNIFAGTNEAGVFLSTNNGDSWKPVNVGLPRDHYDPTRYARVSALATNGALVFAALYDRGVFLSADTGRNWKKLPARGPGSYISGLVIVPSVSGGSDLFAGAGSDVFLSTDNGTNWKPLSVDLKGSAVKYLASVPTGNRGAILFLGAYGKTASSTDRGASWSNVDLGSAELSAITATSGSGGNTDLFAGTYRGVSVSTDGGRSWSSLGVSYAGPNVTALTSFGGYLFAGTVDQGVFRSTDKGASWTEVNTGLENTRILALAVSTSRTGSTSLFAGTDGGGVFRTTDNGQNWKPVNEGMISHVDTAKWVQTNGPCGGRVTSFAFSGRNLFTVSAGHIFLSTDNGTNWRPVNMSPRMFEVSCLAVCPLAGGRGGATLFAATPGYGLYGSTDNGATWKIVETGTNSSFSSFVVDGSTLYAGSEAGAFLSTDGGTLWAQVNIKPEHLNILSIALFPDETGGTSLIAGTWDGVFVSKDSGATWKEVKTSPMYTRVYTFAVMSKGVPRPYLFVGSGEAGVCVSTDYGRSWKPANTGLTNTKVTHLLASGTNLSAGTYGGGVFRSTNYGTSWTAINTGLMNYEIGALAAGPVVDNAAGADLFVGTSGAGAYRSTNNGTTWTEINAGMASTDIYALAVSQDVAIPGHAILFAAASHAGVFRSTDNGTTWTASGLPNADIRALVASPASGGSASPLYAGTLGAGVFRSTNNGASWSAVNSGLTNLAVLSLIAVPSVRSGPATLFAGTNEGAFRSTNDGATWISVNSGLKSTSGATSHGISGFAAIPDGKGGTNLFATVTYGGMFLTTNNGTTWNKVRISEENSDVCILGVGPPTGATGTRGLFVRAMVSIQVSTDNGTSWASANGDLPEYAHGRSLAVWQNEKGTVYLVYPTDRGVFLSTNNGASWIPIDSGLHLQIACVVVSPDGAGGANLFAGTQGAGVWRYPLK